MGRISARLLAATLAGLGVEREYARRLDILRAINYEAVKITRRSILSYLNFDSIYSFSLDSPVEELSTHAYAVLLGRIFSVLIFKV